MTGLPGEKCDRCGAPRTNPEKDHWQEFIWLGKEYVYCRSCVVAIDEKMKRLVGAA